MLSNHVKCSDYYCAVNGQLSYLVFQIAQPLIRLGYISPFSKVVETASFVDRHRFQTQLGINRRKILKSESARRLVDEVTVVDWMKRWTFCSTMYTTHIRFSWSVVEFSSGIFPHVLFVLKEVSTIRCTVFIAIFHRPRAVRCFYKQAKCASMVKIR